MEDDIFDFFDIDLDEKNNSKDSLRFEPVLEPIEVPSYEEPTADIDYPEEVITDYPEEADTAYSEEVDIDYSEEADTEDFFAEPQDENNYEYESEGEPEDAEEINKYNEIEEVDEDETDEDDEAEEGSRGISIVREILSYVLIIAAAFILAVLVQKFIILNATVPTGSMSPNIEAGYHILGTRLTYKFEAPQRGDVVIFKYPDDESQLYVKRVIGLPGDTVAILDGRVYINGELLDESSYLKDPETDQYYNGTPYGTFGPYTVPANSYFMMGDNRNSSWDSRYWSITYVKDDLIVAKAAFSFYPKFKSIK